MESSVLRVSLSGVLVEVLVDENFLCGVVSDLLSVNRKSITQS